MGIFKETDVDIISFFHKNYCCICLRETEFGVLRKTNFPVVLIRCKINIIFESFTFSFVLVFTILNVFHVKFCIYVRVCVRAREREQERERENICLMLCK